MVACLESGNYIQIRNALIVLTKVRGVISYRCYWESKYIQIFDCISKCFSWSLNVQCMIILWTDLAQLSQDSAVWTSVGEKSGQTPTGRERETTWYLRPGHDVSPTAVCINMYYYHGHDVNPMTLYLHVLVPRPRCKSNDCLYLHVLVPRPWCLIRNLHNHVHVGNNTYKFCWCKPCLLL